MQAFPRDKEFDNTLRWLQRPYDFIRERAHLHGSDVFETRILLRKTLCMTGPLAAELLCDPTRFTRAGAAPEALQATLTGKGGVQGMDGEAHRHRKEMFLSFVTPERVAELGRIFRRELRHKIGKWRAQPQVTLYDELQEILTRAACEWAGVPLEEKEVACRTREITAMFDAAGAKGPRHLWSRLARKRGEAWAMRMIREVREGDLVAPLRSPLETIAGFRDANGERLSLHTAAVELLNVIRPIVAVSVFVTQAAHALEMHPDIAIRLRQANAAYALTFQQEVRRFYPFFPVVAARVREDFEWRHFRFRKGTRVLFDLHSTNHDPRSWDHPDQFRPERFLEKLETPYNFVPQGAGDPQRHHRCPGEPLALVLMQNATDFLLNEIVFDVPKQNLTIDRSRMPPLPRSRFVMANVQIAPKLLNRATLAQTPGTEAPRAGECPFHGGVTSR